MGCKSKLSFQISFSFALNNFGKFSWKEQRFLIWRLILDIYLDLKIFTLDLKGELL